MPKLPITTQALLRGLRAYSPITTDQRHTMERQLRTISQTTRLGPKEAQRIADAFRPPLVQVGRAAVAGFVEYGYWLQRLHERVPHGLWLSLFTGAGARDGLLRPIPISRQQAQALVRIAKHPLLSNPDVLDQLPPHWRTLDTLTRVPDPVLDESFTKGRIHSKMQRVEAEALIPRAGARDGFVPHAATAPETPALPGADAADDLVALIYERSRDLCHGLDADDVGSFLARILAAMEALRAMYLGPVAAIPGDPSPIATFARLTQRAIDTLPMEDAEALLEDVEALVVILKRRLAERQ